MKVLSVASDKRDPTQRGVRGYSITCSFHVLSMTCWKSVGTPRVAISVLALSWVLVSAAWRASTRRAPHRYPGAESDLREVTPTLGVDLECALPTRVALDKGEHLSVVVTNVNPIAYTARTARLSWVFYGMCRRLHSRPVRTRRAARGRDAYSTTRSDGHGQFTATRWLATVFGRHSNSKPKTLKPLFPAA